MYAFFGYPFELKSAHCELIAAICAKRALPFRASKNHFSAESIWDRIKADIEGAAFAIFDLTSYNHNVLLELGYALGTKRDVILLLHTPNAKKDAQLHNRPLAPPPGFPSNLAGLRRIQYVDRFDLERQLLEALDNVIKAKPRDDQFWIYLRNFLKDGSQDRQSISTFMKDKLAYSEKMTGDRLERHYSSGQLTKRMQGRVSVYELSQSVLH